MTLVRQSPSGPLLLENEQESLLELRTTDVLTEMPSGLWFLLDLWPSGPGGGGGSRNSTAGLAVGGGGFVILRGFGLTP